MDGKDAYFQTTVHLFWPSAMNVNLSLHYLHGTNMLYPSLQRFPLDFFVSFHNPNTFYWVDFQLNLALLHEDNCRRDTGPSFFAINEKDAIGPMLAITSQLKSARTIKKLNKNV